MSPVVVISVLCAYFIIKYLTAMAEKLLKSLQDMNEKFEVKLLVMNLISRLIGIHEVILFSQSIVKDTQKEDQ